MSTRKWLFTIFGMMVVVVLVVAIWLRLAFRGDLDSGTFKIVQQQTALPNRIAMLAERPGTKWSGNTFFVVIGDHSYSPAELRKSLYDSQIVFEVGRGGLDLAWESPTELIVKCIGCDIEQNMIQVQKFRDGEIDIKYIDFPQKTASPQ